MTFAQNLVNRFYVPGIYLDMPEDEYFADESIGGSTVKGFSHNANEWWWQSGFNPLKIEFEEKKKATAGKRFGTAAHKILLEGIDAYEAEYCREFDGSKHPDALNTNDQMKAWLKERELKQSGNKDDLIARILEADASVPIYAQLEAEYDASVDGREQISEDWDKSLRIMRRIADRDPLIRETLGGGLPEVSIFWNEDGVPCRARLDKWKIGQGIDLKSFSVMPGKSVLSGCVRAIMNYRYDLQEAHYRSGLTHAKDLPIFGGTPEQRDYIKQCQAAQSQDFSFVFCKSIGAPIFATATAPLRILEAAQHTREAAFRKWRQFKDEFGFNEPWIVGAEDLDLTAEDFPAYFGIS